MRNNPKEYAKVVESHIQYIKYTEDSKKVYENGDYKMSLVKGEEAFRNCIDILSKTNPLKTFEFSDEIRIICPDKIDEQSLYYQDQLDNLREKHSEKKIEFNFDIAFPKPEIITVLQLVDDNNSHKGNRRANLLNENFRNVGISIKKSRGKTFCVYMTFSN